MATKAPIKTPIPTTSGLHNLALSTLHFANIHRPTHKPPIQPSLPKNYDLFMQNKANLPDAQMNVKSFITKDYRKNDAFAVQKNKPNSNPNKANLPEGKTDAMCVFTKDYEEKCG